MCSGFIVDPKNGGWARKITRPSGHLIPKTEINREECQHLDSCGFVQASSSSAGWLVFKLPKMTQGIVIICGCCGKKIGESFFKENKDLQVQFDGKNLTNSEFVVAPEKKCVQVLSKFPSEVQDTGGHLYLGLRITQEKSKTIGISHVITQ